jgi:hypothetical protein
MMFHCRISLNRPDIQVASGRKIKLGMATLWCILIDGVNGYIQMYGWQWLRQLYMRIFSSVMAMVGGLWSPCDCFVGKMTHLCAWLL